MAAKKAGTTDVQKAGQKASWMVVVRVDEMVVVTGLKVGMMVAGTAVNSVESLVETKAVQM